jgi:NAD(P)-dependent dehydrogenase (short-subunit alcohol dehydrogenase family)
MSHKTVLITGGNRGIGLSLVKCFQKAGDRVIASCRQASDELQALNIEIIEGIDVRNPKSLYNELQERGITHLDILVNNAGILRNEVLGSINYQQILEQIEINALAPLKVVENLLPLMISGSKIVNITSRMGSIADNTSGSRYGYRMSKAALNMASMSLAQDLKKQGIAVCVIHPGFVRTGMTSFNGLLDANESASGIYERIQNLDISLTGSFWHAQGEILPW